MAKKENKKDPRTSDDLAKPDPETLHTTDPQENMEGPLSSIVQNIKEEAEENDADEKKESDR